MTAWATVGRGDPVLGDVDEFRRTSEAWRGAASGARSVERQFRDITCGAEDSGFAGQAADAFRALVEQTKLELADIPPVCDDLAWILSEHARRLADLRRAADEAVARATTAWNQRNQRTAERDRANVRAAALRRQIDDVRRLPPEQAGAQLQTLQWNFSVESANAQRAADSARHADSRVGRELQVWDDLSVGEQRLNRETAGRLDGVDLRGLRDPNRLERLGRAVVSAISSIDDIGDLLGLVGEAFLQGLWLLRDAIELLEKVLLVATVILVVIAAGLLIFSGIGAVAGLATMFVLLAKIGAVLAVSKLATTVILVPTQSTNVRSGERLGAGDLLVDSVSAVLALTALGKARQLGPLMNQTHNLRSFNLGRRLVKEELGVTFFRGKMTRSSAWRAPLKLVERGAEEVLLDKVGDVGPRAWQGIPESAKRPAVRRDTRLIRSGNRGLSGGCNVVLAPYGGGGASW